MTIHLRKFKRTELLLAHGQALKVLRFFWTDIRVGAGSLTEEDRSFAQGLLLEAIDASYKMGFAEILTRTFYAKTARSFGEIAELVKTFAKKAFKHWFKHATQEDLENPQIYESVRVTIARSFRSTWKIREETGELTY